MPHSPSHLPIFSRARSSPKTRRTHSSRSDGARSAPVFFSAPLPPPSAGGSGAGSFRRPSQLSQSSVAGEVFGQHPAPASATVPGYLEIVRDHNKVSGSQIRVADAKETVLRAFALGARVSFVERLVSIDRPSWGVQIENAYRVLDDPKMPPALKDQARTLLSTVLTPCRSTSEYNQQLNEIERSEALDDDSSPQMPPPS